MTNYSAYNYLIFFPGTDYYKVMFRDAKGLDNAVSLFWSATDSFLRRLVCSRKFPDFVHRAMFRAFSKVLVRRFRMAAVQMPNPDRPVCFVFNRMFFYMLEMGLYDILKEAFPGSRMVVLLTDLISIHQWLKQIVLRQADQPGADLIYTFDPTEAEKYHIRFHNLPYPDLCGLDFPTEEIYDVFFLGRNKARLHNIRWIHDNLTGRGFRCSFRVTDVSRKERKKAGSGIRICDWVPYEDYLKEESKSRAILEIVQGESSGNTLRVYEAIMLGKKLLTNNRHLKNNPVYDPDNMFIFENPEDIPDEFLRREVSPYSEELKKKISLKSFLEDVGENLNRIDAEKA